MISPIDTSTLTWSCMVCGKVRPDDKIDVAHRPIAGCENVFPATRSNIAHCNDNPECVQWAHAAGPWQGPKLPWSH